MTTDGDEYLTIRKILTFHLREETQFLDFIKALVREEIVLYAGEEDSSFADYKLIANSYFFWKSQWLKKHQTTKSLSAREVASVLGVKDQVVYGMINNGLLAHVVVGNQRMVKPSSLKRFREKYVFNREVADQFRISPKMVVSCLSEDKFKPAAGPHILNHPCRHYIWRRTDELYDFLNSKFPYRNVRFN
ncbi:Helix-turn-helix domain protein [compost metagenome]